jgi:hypothetical protein
LIPTIIFILLVGVSRIYHGVHTYNQILLGWAFGLFIFLTFCRILFVDIERFVLNINKMAYKDLIWNRGTQVALAIYVIAHLNFFYGDDLHPVPSHWKEKMISNCQGKLSK